MKPLEAYGKPHRVSDGAHRTILNSAAWQTRPTLWENSP